MTISLFSFTFSTLCFWLERRRYRAKLGEIVITELSSPNHGTMFSLQGATAYRYHRYSSSGYLQIDTEYTVISNREIN